MVSIRYIIIAVSFALLPLALNAAIIRVINANEAARDIDTDQPGILGITDVELADSTIYELISHGSAVTPCWVDQSAWNRFYAPARALSKRTTWLSEALDFNSRRIDAINVYQRDATDQPYRWRRSIDTTQQDERGRLLPPMAAPEPEPHLTPADIIAMIGQPIEPPIHIPTTEEALINAIRQDDFATVHELLLQGANANTHDLTGDSVLSLAARAGHSAIVQELLAHGAIVDAQDQNRWTALMAAIHNNHIDVVHLLIQAHANPDIVCGASGTALTRAVEMGNLAMVQMLIIDGHANPNVLDQAGKTALWIATIRRGGAHLDIMRFLVEHGAQVNAQDSHGKTALMSAAFYGYEPEVKFLLESGANPDAQERASELLEFGRTALIVAIGKGHSGVVRLLVELGHANLNIKDRGGCTALIHAIEHQDAEMVNYLVEQHADVNIKDNRELTALIIAARNGDVDSARALMRVKHIQINPKRGDSALALAIEQGHRPMIDFLLANPLIDPNSGLACAAKKGDLELVKTLVIKHHANVNNNDALIASLEFPPILHFFVEHGADINRPALLCEAVCRNNESAVHYLLSIAHVDPNRRNKRCMTALMEAAQEGYLPLVRLLLEAGSDPLKLCYGVTAGRLARESKHIDVATCIAPYEVRALKLARDSVIPSQPVDALFHAVKIDDLALVKTLLARYPGFLNTRDEAGMTALMVASALGHIDIVEYLIKQGVQVDAHDFHMSSTALIMAATNGHAAVVQTLVLQGGADIKKTDGEDRRALYYAREGHYDEILYFLREMWNHPHIVIPTHEDIGKKLRAAAKSGDLTLVQQLVTDYPSFIDEQEDDWSLGRGASALTLAWKNGFLDIVHYLVKVGHAHLDLYGQFNTPSEIEALQQFLKSHTGAAASCSACYNPDQADKEAEMLPSHLTTPETQFAWAAEDGHRSLLLRLADEHPELINQRVTTFPELPFTAHFALRLAINRGHRGTLRALLVDLQANLEGAECDPGTSLIFEATRNGNLDIVQWLVINRHVNPNMRDIRGATALMYAACEGHLAIVQFLVDYAHASIHMRNSNERTAYDLALANHHQEIADFLVTHGARSTIHEAESSSERASLLNPRRRKFCCCTIQ